MNCSLTETTPLGEYSDCLSLFILAKKAQGKGRKEEARSALEILHKHILRVREGKSLFWLLPKVDEALASLQEEQASQ